MMMLHGYQCPINHPAYLSSLYSKFMFSLQSCVDASKKGKTVYYYLDFQLSSWAPAAIACSNEPWHPYTTERWLINCVHLTETRSISRLPCHDIDRNIGSLISEQKYNIGLPEKRVSNGYQTAFWQWLQITQRPHMDLRCINSTLESQLTYSEEERGLSLLNPARN